MNMFLHFITILAWIMVVCCPTATALRLYAEFTYTDLQRTIDAIKGVRVTFPIGNHMIGTVLAVVWLIAYYYPA